MQEPNVAVTQRSPHLGQLRGTHSQYSQDLLFPELYGVIRDPVPVVGLLDRNQQRGHSQPLQPVSNGGPMGNFRFDFQPLEEDEHRLLAGPQTNLGCEHERQRDHHQSVAMSWQRRVRGEHNRLLLDDTQIVFEHSDALIEFADDGPKSRGVAPILSLQIAKLLLEFFHSLAQLASVDFVTRATSPDRRGQCR